MSEQMERAYRPAVLRAFGHAARALDIAGLPALAAEMRAFDVGSPWALMEAKALEAGNEAASLAEGRRHPDLWTRAETDARCAAEASFHAWQAAALMAGGDYLRAAGAAEQTARCTTFSYHNWQGHGHGAAVAEAARDAERALCAEDVRAAETRERKAGNDE